MGDDGMEPVAIVGMALRVPGADTLESFWSNLRDGVESIRFFSEEELRARGVPEASLRDPNYVRAFGALPEADCFDAGFFEITPREAETLDPQHRKWLECAWEALEHAGYDPKRYPGRIGLFGGVGLNAYLLQNLMGHDQLLETMGPWQLTLGNDKDFATTRVGYKLDLRGPVVSVSTACSTSLVGVSLGCQSLLTYQCDMVLAGGCSIHLPQDEGYWYSSGGTLSPDGHCRAFDAKAQGTLDGNGAVVVVLKRLSDALADGDTIHALILGTAINNDGGLKVGYTAPSVEGQAAVILEAQEVSNVTADSISYVETHGTGTDLGDMVEIAALTQAFRQSTQRVGFCGIGSVKTNIGHLDTAAGTASLVKVVLALQNGKLPPSLHFAQPNPKLELPGSPFYVNARLRDWPRHPRIPRRAGISSFGIGGTNAHLIVQEAPLPPATAAARPWQLLPVSARQPEALARMTQRLARTLGEQPEAALADVAFTLQVGRHPFAERHVTLARTLSEAGHALEATAPPKGFRGRAPLQAPAVVYLLPGQDAQHANMAEELLVAQPAFRAAVEECARFLRDTHRVDLYARMNLTRETAALLGLPAADAEGQIAHHPQVPDPLLLFVVEYSLAQFWHACGVNPQALFGYSLGEYVVACLAGVLTLEDALTVAVANVRLLERLSPGSLLAVPFSEAEARACLAAHPDWPIDLALITAPQQCVLGGSVAAVTVLEEYLRGEGLATVRLPLPLAFHTREMEPFLETFRAQVRALPLQAPRIPYVSGVTGDWIRPEEAQDPEYFVRIARSCVRLSAGLSCLAKTHADAQWLEVGPGQMLASLTQLQTQRPSSPVLTSLRDVRYPPNAHHPATLGDEPALLTTLGRLWVAGVEVDWHVLHRDHPRRRVPLPGYAFAKTRFWMDPPRVGSSVQSVAGDVHALSARAGAEPDADPAAPRKCSDLSQWGYRSHWQEEPRLAATTVQGTWLLVQDHIGLGEVLTAAGATVLHAEDFGFTDLDTDTAAFPQRAAWTHLLTRLQQAQSWPDHIVHLGLVAPTPAAARLAATQDWDDPAALARGYGAGLALAQALARHVFAEPLSLHFLGTGLCALHAGEDLVPAHAALRGLALVIAQEYSHLHCQVIDLAPPPAEWQWPVLRADLVREMAAAPGSAGRRNWIALRAGQRWSQLLSPHALPPSATTATPATTTPATATPATVLAGSGSAPSSSLAIRPQGVYLITGGLGNVGLTLASTLARVAPASTLILTGRTGLPPRTAWAAQLADPATPAALRHRLTQVQALEAQGAQVWSAAVDVADAAGMARLLEEIDARHGALHGVIHAAGLVGEASFRALGDTDAAFSHAHFAAKLSGTRVLEALLGERPLDFCLLCSSLSPLLGGLGFAAYASSNAALNACAERHNQRHAVPWTAVLWEGWQFPEYLEGDHPPSPGTPAYSLDMLPAEGAEVFLRILSGEVPRTVVISATDLLARQRRWVEWIDAPVPATTGMTRHPRPEMLGPRRAPVGAIQERLTELWEDLLGIDGIGSEDSFFELGGNSLLLTQLVARIRKTFGVDLALAQLFEEPVIERIAAQIEAQQAATTAAVTLKEQEELEELEEGEL
jgi:phthiocerol/phenolphthiocerol synthesis type-I polyketide synthase E